ncbi:hypothetical protein X728_06595 [Mesorhizobium sp. L103C120A0]|nr:hypothetical protein X728_06595 [Mesorhizobium sp. L103C120A0]
MQIQTIGQRIEEFHIGCLDDLLKGDQIRVEPPQLPVDGGQTFRLPFRVPDIDSDDAHAHEIFPR